MDNSTQNNANNTVPTQAQLTQTCKKSTGMLVVVALCAILAITGIAFGIFELLDSNQKNQRISELETKLNSKESEITELKNQVSSLETQTDEPTTIIENDDSGSTIDKGDKTAKIILGTIIDENETRTVFKIGDCTADGPSVKCPVDIDGKQALISYLSTDSMLRLTLPNE